MARVARTDSLGRRATHVVVVAIVLAHGSLHLLGAAKGLGWAKVPALSEPIGRGAGGAWLVAAVLVLAAGTLLAAHVGWWWAVGLPAAAVSQAMILTSWSDAGVGSGADLVLLVAAGYGYASQGPRSYRAEYRRLVDAALIAGPRRADPVTEQDLVHLPPLVAAYIRASGAVGRPPVTSFRARFHGRIRAGAGKPWMRFTGEQVNTFGPDASRLFLMDATLFGLPIDVLHVFRGRAATMRVKLFSLVPLVNAAGPEMDKAETVTLFNDLCLMAPAALITAPVTWRALDARRVRADFTHGANTVSAVLVFDDAHDLVDFVSDDRSVASRNGTLRPRRWSTPVGDHQTLGTRRVLHHAEAHWHGAEATDEFAYLELCLDGIDDNPGPPPSERKIEHGRDEPARLGLPAAGEPPDVGPHRLDRRLRR